MIKQRAKDWQKQTLKTVYSIISLNATFLKN